MATGDANSSYYTAGNEEAAQVTPLTLRKLTKRNNLTGNSKRLVIALVGLPARGKSFVARKLLSFLTWRTIQTKVFNVGKYRREAAAELATKSPDDGRAESGACNADFFDANNVSAATLREKVAEMALIDMLKWLDGEDEDAESVSTSASNADWSREGQHNSDRIAIFDATNSTAKRRAWILDQCTHPSKRAGKPTGVVFVESICDDIDLLRENYKFKVESSPDYKDMNIDDAMADLMVRVQKYEEQYETITDESQSYIKIFNLSTKLMVNHIYGRMAKLIVPALMAWNVGIRPVFLCRPGKVPSNVKTDEEDYVAKVGDMDLTVHTRKLSNMNNSLGPTGQSFRNELWNFIAMEGNEFMMERAAVESMYHRSLHTGTSRTGLSSFKNEVGIDGKELPFPCRIFTSTMPRAVETVDWDYHRFPIDTLSNLNPLDKGDYAGMELGEIKEVDSNWYAKLEQDPFFTRFPGGECYRDVINRLETVIIDVEQQVSPVLVVSHVSVLQTLIAYFRASPVEKCMSIEVPMHTVIKFTPSRGGGWKESRYPLMPEDELGIHVPLVSSIASELSTLTTSGNSQCLTPIWGDPIQPGGNNLYGSISSSTTQLSG